MPLLWWIVMQTTLSWKAVAVAVASVYWISFVESSLQDPKMILQQPPKSTKFYVLLWRLRWGFLNSFSVIGQWGIPGSALSSFSGELRNNWVIFSSTSYFPGMLYPRFLLQCYCPCMKKALVPGISGGDIRVGKIMEVIQEAQAF